MNEIELANEEEQLAARYRGSPHYTAAIEALTRASTSTLITLLTCDPEVYFSNLHGLSLQDVASAPKDEMAEMVSAGRIAICDLIDRRIPVPA